MRRRHDAGHLPKHPLSYSGDRQPRQLNSQGLKAFGAMSYVLGPAGNQGT